MRAEAPTRSKLRVARFTRNFGITLRARHRPARSRCYRPAWSVPRGTRSDEKEEEEKPSKQIEKDVKSNKPVEKKEVTSAEQTPGSNKDTKSSASKADALDSKGGEESSILSSEKDGRENSEKLDEDKEKKTEQVNKQTAKLSAPKPSASKVCNPGF